MNEAMPYGDVKPRHFGPPVLAMPAIHVATDADKPFMLALAREKYPGRNIDLGIPWVERCMANPDRLVLVGPNSFGIAQADWLYGFERRGRLDMLCARPQPGVALEALRMVRMMVGWAKSRGCLGTFKLDADTGVDFGPFARRLGGVKVTSVRYEIPLE
ncbi:MAG: hypothetical protein WC829_01275 [Hyphomicrobium sp.]|jgi:hypothetical protein